ncbi:MAG: class I SAM-dependent methyltransferase [Candidatus Contendobacter sp.]|jgi:SAM-dependent methyltransferase|nr:class I SAM-dependent methyltransferase [Gammaproteobacteria bacterium]MCC8994668.1 class I SAM-dependent methyltransferase [Candidatus Contendobacter sp.]
MSGFSADWLALREPVDALARNQELTAQLIAWRRQPGFLSVLDLGSGTGANLRFLAPWLSDQQYWRLVDADPILLADGATRFANPGGVAVERLCLDLTDSWERLEAVKPTLVTASALLDLVSADWLESLAQCCQAWQAAVLIVLSYDGTILWEPALADDHRVCAWVNRHQYTDKGFGPALGPDAAPALAALLADRGYQVALRPSPWRLGPEHAAMQTALLAGWVDAAQQIGPDRAGELTAWANQRQVWIAQGQSRLTVGHWDLFATLKAA